MKKFYLHRLSLISICLLFLNGCSRPLSNFSLTQNKAFAPGKVVFKNSSTNAETFIWYFGDGDSSLVREPEHTFLLTGRYTVTLVAQKGSKKHYTKKDIIFNASDECLVLIETSHGSMLVKLYSETPRHRENFINLCESGYYDGQLFHRVIQQFMIQTGDPNSRGATSGQRLGSGGPGYTLPAEIRTNLFHKKGALAAARMGDNVNPTKASSGSQFYIVQGQICNESQLNKNIYYPDSIINKYFSEGGTPQLDGNYTVFGEVVEGLSVIDEIAKIITDSSDRPTVDVKILKTTVIK